MEKKCAHIFAGQVEWSPQVKEAYDLVDFWSMAIDRFRGRMIYLRKFKNYAADTSLFTPWTFKRFVWDYTRPINIDNM